MRHMKQVGAYGLHRGYFARHLPDTSFKLKFFFPSFVLVLTCLAGFIPLWPNIIDNMLYSGLFLYFTVVLVGVVTIAKLTSFRIAGASIVYVVGTHLSYGYNFAKGFLRTRPIISKLR